MQTESLAISRWAAIVDIENLAIVRDKKIAPSALDGLLEQVGEKVTGMQVRVATGRNILGSYLKELAVRPWGVTLVPTSPDAADAALIEAAHHMIDHGVTDLVVASGDHIFASLAGRARLHIITHANHLSRRLNLAATSVAVFPKEPAFDKAAA